MNLSLTLQSVARHVPERPAITWDTGQLNYGQFEHQAACIASGLMERHSLLPGDRIGMLMQNGPEFLAAMYGIWRAGMCAIPINAKLHPKEVSWILQHGAARLVLATPELADAMAGHLNEPWPRVIVSGTRDWTALLASGPVDDPPTDPHAEAWIFYTSGTTGRPKGAVLTHRNLMFAIHAYYADIDFVGPGDTMVHAAPLSHGSGLYALAHIARGSNQVIHSSFEPEQVLQAFGTFANVSMFAAPTMVTRLLNHPAAGSVHTGGLKTIIYGGAPMYVADLKRALAAFGPKFFQLYGQGEAPMTITGLSKAMHADFDHPRYERRLGSAGVARTGVAFKIVDETGVPLRPGEVGEIITRSGCVMKGYWNNPDANTLALRDGWLWTGDLGSVDAHGFLTIKDRSKDMIITGGANVYPREIEEVLLTHSHVLECAVASRPHADWGEEVIAFVVTRPGTEVAAADLDRLCLANIARFKRPKGYRFVAHLPKNNYGKVLKTELRNWLSAEPSAAVRAD